MQIMKTIHKILSYKRVDNRLIASFRYTTRLSIINSDEIEEELLQLVKNGETSLFLDLYEIKFIDSAGFRSLLSVHIDAKLKNVEFAIINANEDILELFNLVELNTVFDIRSNLEFIQEDFKKAS